LAGTSSSSTSRDSSSDCWYGIFCAPEEAITAVQGPVFLRVNGLTHWDGRT
jgi:hypothetical protein